MTLMTGLYNFFLEMSKKCWPRFRVGNSTFQTWIPDFIFIYQNTMNAL
jgi:hypothetical protein